MQRGGCPGGCVLFSSRSRHTRCSCDWSSDVCSSDLSLVSARGGLWLLYQGWLDLINTAMVRQTRFDALHDAATEQQLFEALPRLARDAMAQGVATAALTTAGERVEVPVTRDQLAHAAQPVWRRCCPPAARAGPARSRWWWAALRARGTRSPWRGGWRACRAATAPSCAMGRSCCCSITAASAAS